MVSKVLSHKDPTLIVRRRVAWHREPKVQSCMVVQKVSTFLSKFVDVASNIMQGSAQEVKLSCRSIPDWMGGSSGYWIHSGVNMKILRLFRGNGKEMLTGCYGLSWNGEQVLRTSGYSEFKTKHICGMSQPME
jgi:hypothetical protein